MQPEEDAHDILARFPGPVTFVPSRRRWLLIFLGAAAFTAIGIWMVASGNAVGWFVLLFFGLCAAVGLAAMLPGAGGLTLNRDGFEIVNLFRRSSFRWADVDDFGSARIPPSGHNMVVFNDAKAKGRAVATLNVGLVGRNAGLPDNYGMSAQTLAWLMARWRVKALGPAPSS